MESWKIVLEYLRVVLSPHVVWGAVVLWASYLFRAPVGELLNRPWSVKGPGGYEVRTEGSQKALTEAARLQPAAAPNAAEKSAHENSIEGWKAAARIWEYRYLHYFLARGTQVVLDWLATREGPVTIQAADAFWATAIPDANERRAILDALTSHDLVVVDGDRLVVTDKGREYREFRGPLPTPPPAVPPTSR